MFGLVPDFLECGQRLASLGGKPVLIDIQVDQISASVNINTRLTLLKCCFTSTETVGLLGTRAQDVHLDFHTAPELPRLTSGAVLMIIPQTEASSGVCLKLWV